MSKIPITMKIILFVLMAITTTMIFGVANADAPFEVSGTGVVIPSYDIDPEVNSLILQVQVNDSQGVLELTLERNFLDSITLEGDDEFFILIDGEKLPYVETNTDDKSRTIEAKLVSGDYEVEIFGSHLLGKTVEDNAISSQIKKQNKQLKDENELLSKQISDLSVELVDVKTENNVLESKNKELDKTIFNPNKLVSETQVQANNLVSETEKVPNITSIITQQITAFTAWFGSLF